VADDRLGEPTIPTSVIVRFHAPPSAPYTTYRDCLRWEFAFHCAFCWLHEYDFAPTAHGSGRTGLFWIEHRELRGHRADLVHVYSNCLWSCRFCNGARADRPCESHGATLLSPTEVAWADHFRLEAGNLLPLSDDADARYTHETYDLDDPRKVALRRDRAARARELERAFAELPPLLDRLLERAAAGDRDCLLAAHEVQRVLRRASEDVSRMRVIPADAPTACRCDAAGTLPAWAQST